MSETVELKYPEIIPPERREYIKHCLELCKKFHAGQTRRGSDEPYHNHPIRVANSLGQDCCHLIPAALLHDVIEDCDVTIRGLSALGIRSDDLELIDHLTHYEGLTYLQYIQQIISFGDAIRIKIADINDNLVGATGTLKDKYELALYILEGAL